MAKKKRKKRVVLNHEQRRAFAKQLLAGRGIKQLAAEYGIGTVAAYNIANEYLVVLRSERYPDHSEPATSGDAACMQS